MQSITFCLVKQIPKTVHQKLETIATGHSPVISELSSPSPPPPCEMFLADLDAVDCLSHATVTTASTSCSSTSPTSPTPSSPVALLPSDDDTDISIGGSDAETCFVASAVGTPPRGGRRKQVLRSNANISDCEYDLEEYTSDDDDDDNEDDDDDLVEAAMDRLICGSDEAGDGCDFTPATLDRLALPAPPGGGIDATRNSRCVACEVTTDVDDDSASDGFDYADREDVNSALHGIRDSCDIRKPATFQQMTTSHLLAKSDKTAINFTPKVKFDWVFFFGRVFFAQFNFFYDIFSN